jgi:hypothetical protein
LDFDVGYQQHRESMALAEVKAYFKQWNMEGRIMELDSAPLGYRRK